MEPLEAVQAWRRFANELVFNYRDERRTWAEHIARLPGFVDEEEIIQPVIFPRFAKELLGFEIGQNLAAEYGEAGGKPDFTPADAVTHPFVFETKGTREQLDLRGHEAQVERYLREGGNRIKQVVLTNLMAVFVYELNDDGRLSEPRVINLQPLLRGLERHAADTGDARQLAVLFENFHYQELTAEEKLRRVREAPEWNPILEATDPGWLATRLLRVVEVLRRDARLQLEQGSLTDAARVSDRERESIRDELRQLDWRLGGAMEEVQARGLDEYVDADAATSAGRACEQYVAHVAYFTATRLALVRIWEDLNLLPPILHDGGFDDWMTRLDDVLGMVIRHSFEEAGDRYPALFNRQNNYTWYSPSDAAHTEAIYELANTYLGTIRSDVLGDVYQSLLEQIDRKNIGQYYTPRDVIGLMWDMVGWEDLAAQADSENRELRVLDIATGSGGFLVDAASRLRTRSTHQRNLGAARTEQQSVQDLASGLVGVEIQRFPAYLAELNILVQVGLMIAEGEERPAIPPLAILCADTMGLHEPLTMVETDGPQENELLAGDDDRAAVYTRVKDVARSGFFMDVACGNPPYVGETRAAPVLRRTREEYPYWEHFVAPHLDVLYWFLILGISKLREGGRFAFITTEYWLRADGARPLREYVGSRCRVETILLFRNLRLFPDAPGQHSMIVIGERIAPPDAEIAAEGFEPPDPHFPNVSVYEGENLRERDRVAVLAAFREGARRSRVNTFQAGASPNALLGRSWAEVSLSPTQLTRRRRLLTHATRLEIDLEEGVIATPDKMRAKYAEVLPEATLRDIGWPQEKRGIFVLNPEEVAVLGRLTAEEEEVLRPVLNTRDVHPYAAVPSPSSRRMIYLDGSDDGGDGPRVDWPFPDRLPHLQEHLLRFQPLLAGRVEKWEENRPWWRVHRPRPRTFVHEGQGRWADYGVATRWGANGRLIVGLAPNGVVPLSGLNAVLPRPGASAAYIVGMFNSAPVQDLAESLPPGELRQADIHALGLPLVPDAVEAVGEATLKLAELVHTTLTDHAPRWPRLAEELRDDNTWAVSPFGAWLPEIGPPASWGPINRVAWITELATHGGQARKIEDVVTERDLFGASVLATGYQCSLRIRLLQDDDDLLEAMAAYVRAIAIGGRMSDIPTAHVPIEAQELVAQKHQAELAVEALADNYRDTRRDIDAVFQALI